MAAFSLTELLFVLGLVATLGGLATAHVQEAVADARAAGAARYLSARLHDIRTQAIVRGAATAMRVSQVGTSYQMSPYVDGNGNGVLARDIQDGIDVQTAVAEMLSERFPGVEFGA
ncbi:MAG: hypothetical protein LBQ09_00220, partial [Acidobacteriaceae bacterium]|nr:hypothetical protein [Acidobacteriaceae bacterium]